MGSNGSTISIEHLGADQFSIGIRGHRVTVDQPRLDGGDDTGPTPTELFVGSLAACVAFYARRFLHARGLPDTVEVSAGWWMESRPPRVSRIALRVEAPGVPWEREDAFRRAVGHCTVHNSINDGPEIAFEVSRGGVQTKTVAS